MVKQVILLRTDLGYSKGRLAAFAAHASFKVFLDRAYNPDKLLMCIPVRNDAEHYWLTQQYTKICLVVNSLADLTLFEEKAKLAGLPTAVHYEEGVTPVSLAIGPAENDKIDNITKHLRLLE